MSTPSPRWEIQRIDHFKEVKVLSRKIFTACRASTIQLSRHLNSYSHHALVTTLAFNKIEFIKSLFIRFLYSFESLWEIGLTKAVPGLNGADSLKEHGIEIRLWSVRFSISVWIVFFNTFRPLVLNICKEIHSIWLIMVINCVLLTYWFCQHVCKS